MPDPAKVRRLVFVCHGNICRSAFAEAVAARLGMRTASFGLSTDNDKPAHLPAAAAAAMLGYDMAAHRTTRAQDFMIEAGDLLLAMEVRQLGWLAADPRFAAVPRSLLGLWGKPSFPHLHDPYRLHEDYMRTCFTRIETAVTALSAAFPLTRV